MLILFLVFGPLPVLTVAAVFALQRKWHALAAFTAVIVVIFTLFVGLACSRCSIQGPRRREANASRGRRSW